MAFCNWPNNPHQPDKLEQLCSVFESQLADSQLRNQALERFALQSTQNLDNELIFKDILERELDNHKEALREKNEELNKKDEIIKSQRAALKALADTVQEHEQFISDRRRSRRW